MKKKPAKTHRLQVRAEVDRDTFNFIEGESLREHLKHPDIVRRALRIYRAKLEGKKP